MEKNKVVKFKDFTTNEHTYKVDDEGKIKKQEWELYKDWHPAKFKVMNLTQKADTTPFEEGEFVWVIKRNDNIVGAFSSHLEQSKIEEFFKNLKGEETEDPISNNSSYDNENEDSNL